ncbi:MAG: FecR domain-containing protein, partial [Rhodospirillales bacterium]|nr:FecR domain-containing protein [Rhodospirillales bacterium]
YRLLQGFAQFDTNRGAIVVLEAPCEIELLGDNRVKLTRGKLVGKCLTQKSKGFTVDTPTARIVDIGTEFGVHVGEQGACASHVFEGEIEVTAKVNGNVSASSRQIFAGETLKVNRVGTFVEPTGGELPVFVRSEHFKAKLQAETSPYDRWLAQSYELRRDPDVVLYYAFDNEAESPDVLLNRARSMRGRHDGEINGPTWVAGRFAGKRGLEFRATESGKDLGQHVEVLGSRSGTFDFQNQSFSVAVWFRYGNDGIPSSESYPPLITKGDEAWRLQAFARKKWITWDINNIDDVPNQLTSHTEPFDGQWHFVVAVVEVDPQSRAATHHLYVDGRKEVSYQPLQQLWRNTEPVLLGANTEWSTRRFYGVLDEVIV